MVYSQHDEEQYITGYFGSRIGRFLDLGAWSGVIFSNTRKLADLGWRGACIEPSPPAFTDLLKNYAGNDRVQMVNAAVAPEPGWLTFHDSNGDAISTAIAENTKRWTTTAWRSFHLWAVTPRQLFDHLGGSFEFLNLDAEGMSLPILEQMPLGEMGTDLVCVEHDNRIDEVRRICAGAGLNRELLCNGENLILGR